MDSRRLAEVVIDAEGYEHDTGWKEYLDLCAARLTLLIPGDVNPWLYAVGLRHDSSDGTVESGDDPYNDGPYGQPEHRYVVFWLENVDLPRFLTRQRFPAWVAAVTIAYEVADDDLAVATMRRYEDRASARVAVGASRDGGHVVVLRPRDADPTRDGTASIVTGVAEPVVDGLRAAFGMPPAARDG